MLMNKVWILIVVLAFPIYAQQLAITNQNPLIPIPSYTPNAITEYDIINGDAGSIYNPQPVQLLCTVKDKNGNNLPHLYADDFQIYITPPNKAVCASYRAYAVHAHYMSDRYYLDIRQPPFQTKSGRYDIVIEIVTGSGKKIHRRVSRAVHYQQPAIDIAFCIDSSSSMRRNDPNKQRWTALFNALDELENNTVPGRFCVITFADTGAIRLPLTSFAQWEKARTAAALYPDGETAIGDALDKAFDELNRSKPDNRKAVVLLTDGKNTCRKKVQYKKYADVGIPIYTIGLEGDTDVSYLKNIARKTHGRYYHAAKAFDLQSIFSGLIKHIGSRYILKEALVALSPAEKKKITIPVASDVRHYSIVARWETADEVNICLRDSKQRLYAQASRTAYVSSGNSFFYTSVFKPMHGEWELIMSNTGDNQNTVTVTAFINDTIQTRYYPIRRAYNYKEPFNITATILEGVYPPMHCTVTAEITRPDGRRDIRQLYDDGAHDDGRAHDGMFTQYYTDTDEAGMYSITIKIDGMTSTGKIFHKRYRDTYVVSDVQCHSITCTPTILQFTDIEQGHPAARGFTLEIEGNHADTISLITLDLTNSNGIVLNASYFTVRPNLIVLQPERRRHCDFHMDIPIDAVPGEYTGSIIIGSTMCYVCIPISIVVNPLTSYLGNYAVSVQKRPFWRFVMLTIIIITITGFGFLMVLKNNR